MSTALAKKEGRPLKITEKVVKKLEEAFIDGSTDEEACIYADITKPTLYDFCKRNPEFTDRKEGLKQLVKFQAKRNIAKAIREKNLSLSQWYLEHRDSDFRLYRDRHGGETKVNILVIQPDLADKYGIKVTESNEQTSG